MSRRFLAVGVSLVVLAAGGWALAQQAGNRAERAASAGRFSVTGSGNTTVLLDTATGKTWVLTRADAESAPFWLPAARVDSVKDVNALLAAEEEHRAVLEVVAREAALRRARLLTPKAEK